MSHAAFVNSRFIRVLNWPNHAKKKSNLHTNSLNKLLFAWYSRMENICSVRQQPFEICRMRHELIEIEEYTPWSLGIQLKKNQLFISDGSRVKTC
jgi:hypothetical protein